MEYIYIYIYMYICIEVNERWFNIMYDNLILYSATSYRIHDIYIYIHMHTYVYITCIICIVIVVITIIIVIIIIIITIIIIIITIIVCIYIYIYIYIYIQTYISIKTRWPRPINQLCNLDFREPHLVNLFHIHRINLDEVVDGLAVRVRDMPFVGSSC